MDEGVNTVPLVTFLNSIDTSLREIRGLLQSKADAVHVEALERRMQALERTSATSDAVDSVVDSMKANRARVWMTISLAVIGQIVTIVLFIVALKQKG